MVVYLLDQQVVDSKYPAVTQFRLTTLGQVVHTCAFIIQQYSLLLARVVVLSVAAGKVTVSLAESYGNLPLGL